MKTLLSGLFFLFTQTLFSQTTVTLSAIKDNTIFSESNNSDGASQFFTAGKNSNGDTRRALIKFDLTTIPASATITSVTLTLTLTKSKVNTDNITLQKLSADWGEGASNGDFIGSGGGSGEGAPAQATDATWACSFSNGAGGCTIAWGTAGGVFSSTISATTAVPNAPTPASYTWSSAQMLADVQGWKNSSSTNFGWIIRSNEAATRTTNQFASRQNTTAAMTPKLSVTYTGGTAPVILVTFKASETKQGVQLNWQTASEFNNSYFLIEHSTDGVNFASIGRVSGAGTSTVIHNYQFLHQGVNEGNHFYRLAQTDLDGFVRYSSVVLITSKDKHLQITISPNPVKSIINVGGIVIAPSTTYSILNSSGAIMLKGNLQSNQIAADALPNGLYMLRINKPNNEFLSGIFVKQ